MVNDYVCVAIPYDGLFAVFSLHNNTRGLMLAYLRWSHFPPQNVLVKGASCLQIWHSYSYMVELSKLMDGFRDLKRG